MMKLLGFSVFFLLFCRLFAGMLYHEPTILNAASLIALLLVVFIITFFVGWEKI